MIYDFSKIEKINTEEYNLYYKHKIILYDKDKMFFNLSFFLNSNDAGNGFAEERFDKAVMQVIKDNIYREFFITDATEPLYTYIKNIKHFLEICKYYNKVVTIITGQNSKSVIDLYESFGAKVIFLPLYSFLFFNREQINVPFYKTNILEKKFITLNRSDKPFRKSLFDFLKNNDLFKFGEYSFLFENVASFKENIDKENRGSFYMSKIVDDFDFNKKCFLNFVIETNNEDYFIFENNKIFTNFVSEKTAKCLYTGLPFILLGEINSLHYLKDYGFKTFSNYWDETYDLEENLTIRTDKAFNVLKDICYQKKSILRKIYNDTEFIHKHNVKLIDDIVYDNLKILKEKINL